MSTESTDIALVAAAAKLPELNTLEARLTELSAKRKSMESEFAQLNERTVDDGKAQAQRREELQSEISVIVANVQDVLRKIAAVRPANAVAIRSALEPFRRRADSALLAAQVQLLSAMEDWNALEAEYQRADISTAASLVPPHILKIRMAASVLNAGT
jgi:DNA repair exonuclease SbcCD ATPase subunit